MDFSKYDPMKEKRQNTALEDQSHESWMSSTPVILLIEYLRKYPDQGVTLFKQGEFMGLKFKPAINIDDLNNGRSQIAMNMFGLLQDAADDLKAMIIDGIEIPPLTRTNAT